MCNTVIGGIGNQVVGANLSTPATRPACVHIQLQHSQYKRGSPPKDNVPNLARTSTAQSTANVFIKLRHPPAVLCDVQLGGGINTGPAPCTFGCWLWASGACSCAWGAFVQASGCLRAGEPLCRLWTSGCLRAGEPLCRLWTSGCLRAGGPLCRRWVLDLVGQRGS
jgi:hypothetical protein